MGSCNCRRRHNRRYEDFEDDVCNNDYDDDYDCDNDVDNDDDYDNDNCDCHNNCSCGCFRNGNGNNNDCVAFGNAERLPINICLCYKSITFDGCNFYVTLPEAGKVVVLDRRFCVLGTIDVKEKYDSITYDSVDNVFYATLFRNNKYIVKLDKNFCKIATIPVSIPDLGCQAICSISFNCQTNRIVLVIAGNIVEINKDGTLACKVTPFGMNNVCYAISLAPYYVAIINRDGKQYIKVIDTNSCCDSCEQRIPRDLNLLSLAYYPSRNRRGACIVAIATKNGRCNFIIKIKLKNVCIDNCNVLTCCRPSPCVNQCETPGRVSGVATENCNENNHHGYENTMIDNLMEGRPNCPYHD